MTPLQIKIARHREQQALVLWLTQIPDCDGTSDCFFCAAGERCRAFAAEQEGVGAQ